MFSTGFPQQIAKETKNFRCDALRKKIFWFQGGSQISPSSAEGGVRTPLPPYKTDAHLIPCPCSPGWGSGEGGGSHPPPSGFRGFLYSLGSTTPQTIHSAPRGVCCVSHHRASTYSSFLSLMTEFYSSVLPQKVGLDVFLFLSFWVGSPSSCAPPSQSPGPPGPWLRGSCFFLCFPSGSKSQVLVLARQQILMCSSHSGCGPQGDLRGRRRWGWSAGLGCLDGLGLLADADAVGRRINAARSSLRGGLAPAGLLGGWWQGSVGRGGRMNADLVPQSLSRLP